jgi:WD40 repeat protein
MLRQILRVSCALSILATGFVFVQGQTLSACRPAPALPANPKPGVAGLTFSRDGKTLVVAGGDGKIRFLDAATGEVQRILTGHTNVIYKAVFSPDEKLLASSSRDRTARIWDVASGREVLKLGGFRCPVKAVAFSPDGKLIAAAGNDGMLKLWDLKTGTELKSLVHINSADIDMGTYALAFNRDGKKIYGSNGDGTVSEWDVESGKEARTWKAPPGGSLSLVFTPDYRKLASFSQSTFQLWDIDHWRETLSMSTPPVVNATRFSNPLAISHNGTLVAGAEIALDKQNNYVYVRTFVWDLQTGKLLWTFEGHKFDVDALVFTRDDRYLLTGSVDQTIKFWDMKTGQLARTISLK